MTSMVQCLQAADDVDGPVLQAADDVDGPVLAADDVYGLVLQAPDYVSVVQFCRLLRTSMNFFFQRLHDMVT